MKKNAVSLTEKSRLSLMRLTATAMCLALAMVLPFLTGQLRELGQALSPMHLPVFLAGMLCGWQYGLVCGLVAPLLRSLCFGMPALIPHAVGMAVELAGYGFLSGLLLRLLPKRLPFVYLSLVSAMIFGRVAGGLFKLVMLGIGWIKEYSIALFWSGYVIGTLPGMLLQILLIPFIVIALRRAGFFLNDSNKLPNIPQKT